jgi:hypothetical protein
VYTNENSKKDIFLQKIELQNEAGETVNEFLHDESIRIKITACSRRQFQSIEFGIALLNNYQQRIFTLHIPFSKASRKGDIYEITIRLQGGLITPNNYQFYFDLFTPHQSIFDAVSGYFPVKVVDNGSEYAALEGIDFGFFFMDYTIEQ